MPDDQKGVIHAASDGGVSGEHPAAKPFEFLVGPTTTDQFNTARLRLIPIACWRVDDIRFAFDSSFVNADPAETDNPNDIRAELAHLARLVQDHRGSPLSVFGHADPVGSDDYNKLLSGRRAKVIYGLLISTADSGTAVKLWQEVSNAEAWGANQRQTMQTLTGLPSGTPDSTLFRSYMQKLCPSDLKLTKKDFLGQGADAGGKGDFQGCGEFNPILLFSQEKQAKFDQAQRRNSNEDKAVLEERNAANAPNRRVMVLMFRKGSKVDLAKWPCPRATEGVSGCIKRFWSDGEKRRSTHIQGTDRKFEDTEDTLACRFYQRMTAQSPCEGIAPTGFVELVLRLLDDDDQPRPDVHYILKVGGVVFSKKTNSAGVIFHFIPPDSTQGTLEFDEQKVTLSIAPLPPVETLAGLQIRLNNLGYDCGPQSSQMNDKIRDSIREFQANHKLTVDGEPSQPTENKLKEVYGH